MEKTDERPVKGEGYDDVVDAVRYIAQAVVDAGLQGQPQRPWQTGGSVFAHTSPIYVEVPGQPADAREDAAYFLAWIDRLSAHLHRRDRVSARVRQHVDSQIASARAVYEKLAQQP